MTTYSWEEVAPRGRPLSHGVFRDRHSGAYAIADDSGHFPDETDDGVLWIDLNRPILLDNWARLPLVDEQGEESVTPITPSEALWYANRFSLVIESSGGARYEVSKAANGRRHH